MWWDVLSPDLAVENPFAPVHNPLFLPTNGLIIPVPETWLAVTELERLISSLGVARLTQHFTLILQKQVNKKSRNKVRGVHMPEQAATQSR